MRLTRRLPLALALTSSAWAAQDASSTHQYDSDVSRLRSIVVNNLYDNKEVFLRELLSNANDALEKLRLTTLRDKSVVATGEFNVTISAEPDSSEEGGVGRLVIRDTGIGMTVEELKVNLGTIAKSGTSDFKPDANSLSSENFVGQFGLGAYSAYLVASKVDFASLPPASPSNPNPKQHVFRSSADGSTFDIFEDLRGNTLGERGTEITLYLSEGEGEWLEEKRLRELVEKHSAFVSTFPIYLQTRLTETRPVSPVEHEPTSPTDDEEAVVEEELSEPQMEEVEVVAFEQLNKNQALWMRDHKEVKDADYQELYKAISKDSVDPLTWTHFKGETGSGINFRSIVFVPSELPPDFWHKAGEGVVKNVRMMVKRVFITDDLGENFLPKWLSFLKVVVDADDLPLTVSRNTIPSSKFLAQLSRTLVKRSLDLFSKLALNEPEKYDKLYKSVGQAFKLGIADGKSSTERDKLAKLLRFETNHDQSVSLEQYVAERKQGQKQIFFLAGVGQPASDLLKSPFVEKLDARGYQVLLLNEPLDEIVLQNLRAFDSLSFQDVSKKGFKFGDEELDEEADKKMHAEMKEDFAPLSDWIKKAFGNVISDVVISQRLVSSPTAIVAEDYGMSANMIRLMAAQANSGVNDPMLEFAKSQKRVLEINPHSPLIQGLLEEVGEIENDEEREKTLRETVETLLDVTFVRSGFPVEDLSSFFGRVEGLLRRSVGVPAQAKTYTPPIKPAPAVEEDPVRSTTSTDSDDDEEEVDDLLRSIKDFGAGQDGFEMPSFEDFEREELRKKMAQPGVERDEL